ncbi:glycosyltransferase family 4 protein [Bacillus testis]|uniref:glycosyltransferase family 4 protein n=1 Tax=Bacillus testis TaxID=1622072 RepID=UPI00067EC4F1|nr:glycosyltransferase family 4 protein [Bacillus testis]
MQTVLFIILNSSYGGAEKHVYDLIENLDKDKYRISLIAAKNSKLSSMLKKRINIIEINTSLWNVGNLRKVITQQNPDIIHIHSPRASFLSYISMAGKKKHKKILVTAHGWIPERFKFSKVFEFLYILSLRNVNKIIAVSTQVKNLLIEKGVEHQKISVIPNGIELLQELPVVDCQINKPKFVFVGRFVEEKGLFYLLEAIKKLNNKYFNQYSLDIYGSGPLENQILKFINENKLNNVKLKGFVQPEKVSEVLLLYDVFLLPSVQEGFPYTLIESLSRGLVVLGSDVGGISEVLKDQFNGFLLTPKNSEDIYMKMEMIINMKKDDLTLMKTNAFNSSKPYNLKNMIESIDYLYNE